MEDMMQFAIGIVVGMFLGILCAALLRSSSMEPPRLQFQRIPVKTRPERNF